MMSWTRQKCKKIATHRFARALLANKATLPVSSNKTQLDLCIEMCSAKYCLSGPIISEFSQLVRFRKETHLATSVSRGLQPQDSKIRCSLDRNFDFFLTSDIDFLFIYGQCGDNCK